MLIVEHENSNILLNPLVGIERDTIKISSTVAFYNGMKINVPDYIGKVTDDVWFNITRFSNVPEVIGSFKVFDASKTTMSVFKEPKKEDVTETPIVKKIGVWERIKNVLKKHL